MEATVKPDRLIMPTPAVRVESAQPGITVDADPVDEKRLVVDWDNTIRAVGMANRTMVDRDYAMAEKIVEEEGWKGSKDPKSPEVSDEVAKRSQESQQARITDPVEIAKQLVQQEGVLKGKSTSDAEVQAAAKKESERRTGLMNAYDELYAIQDAQDAYTIAANTRKEAIKKRLGEINTERRKGTPPLDPITTLGDDELAKIPPEPTQADYYDENTRTYHRLDSTGKPINDKTVTDTTTYKPIVAELKNMGAADPPIDVSRSAKELHGRLRYDEKENKFTVESTRQIEAKESKETTEKMFALTANTVENIIETTGINVIIRNKDGNIIGLDEEALKKLDPNEPLATLSILIGEYHRTTDQNVRDNLMTLSYQVLKGVDDAVIEKTMSDPDLKRQLLVFKQQKGDPVFEKRSENLKKELIEKWFKPNGLDPDRTGIDISLAHLPQCAILAMRLEGKIKNAAGPGETPRYPLPDDVQEMLKRWKINDAERQGIIHLALGDGTTGRLLSQVFGLDVEALTGKNVAEVYADRAVTALADTAESRGKPKYTKEKRDAFKKFIKHHFSEESLKKIAEKLGLPPGAGMGIIMLALFLPMLQGLMDTGGGGGSEGGQKG